MEKIQVKVYHNSGLGYWLSQEFMNILAVENANELTIRITASDCDYIRENNLSTVEIEAEWKSNCHNADIEMGTCSECGQHKYSEDCHLVPLITGGFVKVVRPLVSSENITVTHVGDKNNYVYFIEHKESKLWAFYEIEYVKNNTMLRTSNDREGDLMSVLKWTNDPLKAKSFNTREDAQGFVNFFLDFSLVTIPSYTDSKI